MGARHQWMLALNGALLLVPPCVLAVASKPADPAPWAPLYGLLMSALTLVLPLLLVKTWRALFLLHLPLLGVAPVFVWYALTFSAPPDENAFAVVLTSPPSEFLSFIALFDLQLPLLISVAALVLYVGTALGMERQPIPASLRRVVLWLALPVTLVLLCMPSKSPRGLDINIGENMSAYLTSSYPLGGLISIVGGLQGNAQAWGLFERHEPYNARALVGTEPRTHILVIGESARADRFHLLGYTRQTTPELEKLDGLLAFRQTYATGNLTLLAVPMMMTGSAPASYSPQAIHGNLVDLANEAGYFTAWLSNQSIALYKIFRPRPQVWRQSVDTDNWSEGRPTPDDVLLPQLDDVLKNTSPRKFIVIHTYGSHWDYTMRLPDDGFHFSGRDRKAVAMAIASDQTGRVASDAYDDTILHTDLVLSRVIRRASRLHGQVTVTFIPDHGEALFASERRATHGFKEFNVSELHVPLLFWANQAFRDAHPAQWRSLQARQERVVSQDAIFYTTASLLGIAYPAHDASRDLTSENFQELSLDQLQFRIAGWERTRRLQDSLDWPRACHALLACH